MPSFEALFAALSPCIGNMREEILKKIAQEMCCEFNVHVLVRATTQSTTGTEYRQPDRVPDQSGIWFFFTIILSDVVALIILNATTAKAKPVLLVRDTQSPRAKASNLIVLLCHYLTTPR